MNWLLQIQQQCPKSILCQHQYLSEVYSCFAELFLRRMAWLLPHLFFHFAFQLLICSLQHLCLVKWLTNTISEHHFPCNKQYYTGFTNTVTVSTKNLSNIARKLDKTSTSSGTYPCGLCTSDGNYSTDAFGNGFLRNNDHWPNITAALQMPVVTVLMLTLAESALATHHRKVKMWKDIKCCVTETLVYSNSNQRRRWMAIFQVNFSQPESNTITKDKWHKCKNVLATSVQVKQNRNSRHDSKATCTHVPPQNSTDAEDPPGPSGSASSSSMGIPTETTRTGSGYTWNTWQLDTLTLA